MEGARQPAVPRRSQARTSQACQRCRNLKTRCLPSEQPGTCQRCFTSRGECVWAEAPRKPKRVRGPSRISQVEHKIDGLVATLVSPENIQPRLAARGSEVPQPTSPQAGTQPLRILRPLAPGSWLPVPSSFEQQPSSTDQDVEPSQRFLEKLQVIHNFGDESDLSRPPGSLFNSSTREETPIDIDLVNELVSCGEADHLLNEYRSMSDSCPFVPVAPNITAQQLSVTKPMLFLAVLTVASWRDHGRQMKLDENYRQELANRTLIRPRRTLSLIQSTIVYLSWYHFVFSHKTQQIYFLLHLAIGLALDLGLHQKTKRVLEIPGRPKPHPSSPKEQRERQRTFLGCYYLSSTISSGLMKPNLLKYTDYMAECGRYLRHDAEYASDPIIARLISSRRLDDQINDAFNTEEAIHLPITDSRISMNLRFMETQLEEWRRENTGGNLNRAIELSYAFTDMQLHSIGLRPPPPELQPYTSSSMQLNALLSTLEAGKRFFDSMLALPVSEYNLLSFADWMRLPIAIITMSRLCIPSEIHRAAQWDAKAAQDRVRLDLYLESLCYRMQGLSTYDKAKQPHPDFWMAMRMIMDLTRAWYCRKISDGKLASSQATPNELPTPDTMRNINNGSAGMSDASITPLANQGNGCAFPDTASMNAGPNMGNPPEEYDPFAFMRQMDFDMEQFIDMGIWGSESYEGMGFGGEHMR